MRFVFVNWLCHSVSQLIKWFLTLMLALCLLLTLTLSAVRIMHSDGIGMMLAVSYDNDRS